MKKLLLSLAVMSSTIVLGITEVKLTNKETIQLLKKDQEFQKGHPDYTHNGKSWEDAFYPFAPSRIITQCAGANTILQIDENTLKAKPYCLKLLKKFYETRALELTRYEVPVGDRKEIKEEVSRVEGWLAQKQEKLNALSPEERTEYFKRKNESLIGM